LRLANIMDIGPEPPNSGAGPSKARGQQPLTFPATTVPSGEGPGIYIRHVCLLFRSKHMVESLCVQAGPLIADQGSSNQAGPLHVDQ